MKFKLLSDLCEIRLGYSFRFRVEDDPEGDVFVFQPRNVLSDDNFMPKVLSTQIKVHHFLKKNEILFTNRGTFKSKIFLAGTRSVASGGLFVLSVKSDLVLPSYISLYLDSSRGQRALASRQEQMSVPAITLKQLQSIPIPMIPISKQKLLSRLSACQEKINFLTQKLNKLKKQRFDAILKGTFHG